MKFNWLILILLPLWGSAQLEPSEAIINWRYTEQIEIYSMPNGHVVTALQNDHDNENYISLRILAETEDFFYAEILFSFSGTPRQGWIKKNQYIGAFSRNEQPVQDVRLYTRPNDDTADTIELTAWASSFITIDKCQGRWRKITLNYKGKRVSGWIEAAKLCANNYSSCS